MGETPANQTTEDIHIIKKQYPVVTLSSAHTLQMAETRLIKQMSLAARLVGGTKPTAARSSL